MMQWLSELPRHDFCCDPESDKKPEKTFLTMACAQAAKAEEVASNVDTKHPAEEVKFSVNVAVTRNFRLP